MHTLAVFDFKPGYYQFNIEQERPTHQPLKDLSYPATLSSLMTGQQNNFLFDCQYPGQNGQCKPNGLHSAKKKLYVAVATASGTCLCEVKVSFGFHNCVVKTSTCKV